MIRSIALLSGLTLLSGNVVQGFAPVPPSRGVSPGRSIPDNVIGSPTHGRTASTALPMALSEESAERRRKQQLGAGAVLLFGILYDFFVTHHGVGPWDPNYIL
mmetsp:Transcript_23945/g.36420  ORF Transcript_23945/g.36420 Transcript_23945/m.36420 type:complete len:103 (+) Transcript_23945:183-491(+)